MAKEKDTTLQSTDNVLNEQDDSSRNEEGTVTERQFVGQFDQKYDWRFLKNIESIIVHQLDTVTDSTLDPNNLLGPTIDTERLLGEGVFYNSHFQYTILEMGVSWNDVPGVDIEYQILKLKDGEDFSVGVPIQWEWKPKNLGEQSMMGITDTPVIPTTVGFGYPAEDQTNMYEPWGNGEMFNFERCDRIGIKLINPPDDIKDISPITFTFRIRHQKL